MTTPCSGRNPSANCKARYSSSERRSFIRLVKEVVSRISQIGLYAIDLVRQWIRFVFSSLIMPNWFSICVPGGSVTKSDDFSIPDRISNQVLLGPDVKHSPDRAVRS